MKRTRHQHRVDGINERIRTAKMSERTKRIRARQLAPPDPNAEVIVVTCGPVSDQTSAALQRIGERAFEMMDR